MISALVFLQYQSFRNRLTSRFKRLKQPKYLIGAIVGALYFYVYFWRYVFFAPGRQSPPGTFGFFSEHRLLVESAAALILFVIVFMAWLIPHERAALTFSEAEVAFLFPAPVSRRGLIHFKLLRSQLRIIFTVLLLTLFASRRGNPWIHAAGWWLIFSTLNLHFLGCSFARTLLLDRGVSNALRRLLVIGLALVLAAAVAAWAWWTMPDFDWSWYARARFDAVADYAQRALTSGPALYLLAPFRLLARPYLATDATAFLIALGPALLLLLLHYAWVLLSDVAFEEASVAASQKLAERVAAARAGNLHGARKNRKGARALFPLAPTGPPAVALLWKNLISAGQALTWRLWFIIIVLAISLYAALGNNLHARDLFSILAVVIGVLLGWSLLIGPQFVRQDLRQDLPLMDVLKTYPLRGWQVVLGEILAPAAILAVAQWLLVIFGTVLLISVRGLRDGPLPLAIAFGAALLLPILDVLLLLIPNAAVLLFPSWIQTGREGPRGMEATGQRLIMLLGQIVVFAVALLPAAAVFGGVFFVIKLLLGIAIAVPLASLAASVVLAGEAALGLLLLGRWFERFDLSAELSP